MGLTKKVRFDADVLEVLKGMTWESEGKLGKLNGQLDRVLYTKVNKALEAMGGKWNRSKGGHSFPLDPRDSVEGLLETGVLEVARDGFFETPDEVIDQMFALVEPHGRVLEPEAGMGAIARRLKGYGCKIVCVELNEARALHLHKAGYIVYNKDFMEFFEMNAFDCIFMNPPFENLQDIDHVLHAYLMLKEGGTLVSIMSESPFFRSCEKAENFRTWLAEHNAYTVSLPEGSFKTSGTGVNTRLVMVKKG